ncbi:P-loop NTPase fold protein [Mucilaginibacter sp.]|uniref:P-loop NTPase fold protein n=1 Tax=Mucilaginibacter sp. TaxID=1882438 RepID=UPI003D1420EA
MEAPIIRPKANNLEKVIRSYLELETNYALLINGKRGIGKTFFVKNNIVPQIGKVKVHHDQRKWYKPIYISLYGLKQIDEVYTLFAFELLPFLKNNTAKVSMGVAKMVARGLMQFTRTGNIDDYLKDITNTSKSALDTREFVIIFDDLDRLSASISINEFVGFVNSLVEHDNNKVIVIADQDEIPQQEHYRAVKEKTIGTVIEYTSTFEETFGQIILGKYKNAGFPEYYRYLNQLKSRILAVFSQAGSVNLRTLIYFLQHFDQVFHSLCYDLKLNAGEIDEWDLHKLHLVLQFSLAVTIEFKNGVLSYTDPKGIDDVAGINEIKHNERLHEAFGNKNDKAKGKETDAAPKSYREQFIDRYYDKQGYDFYASLFDFITGGNAFDYPALQAELKRFVDDRRQKVYRQDEVMHQLSYPQCYDLDNAKLRGLTEELYGYAVAGQYSLDRYLTVFHYLERFPEILKYDPVEVEARLAAAVEAHAARFPYVPMLDHHFDVREDQPNKELFATLFRKLVAVNQQIARQQEQQTDIDLFKTFKTNPETFYKAVNERYYERPVFASWDFEKFRAQFDTLTGNQLRLFSRFLQDRYLGCEKPKWTEKEFFEKLRGLLSAQPEGEATLRDGISAGMLEIVNKIIAEPLE